MPNQKYKPDSKICETHGVSLPREMWPQADAEAAKRGISRSALIAVAVERELRMPQSGNGPAWGEVQEGGTK